jgi:hypothetical protein
MKKRKRTKEKQEGENLLIPRHECGLELLFIHVFVDP